MRAAEDSSWSPAAHSTDAGAMMMDDGEEEPHRQHLQHPRLTPAGTAAWNAAQPAGEGPAAPPRPGATTGACRPQRSSTPLRNRLLMQATAEVDPWGVVLGPQLPTATGDGSAARASPSPQPRLHEQHQQLAGPAAAAVAAPEVSVGRRMWERRRERSNAPSPWPAHASSGASASSSPHSNSSSSSPMTHYMILHPPRNNQGPTSHALSRPGHHLASHGAIVDSRQGDDSQQDQQQQQQQQQQGGLGLAAAEGAPAAPSALAAVRASMAASAWQLLDALAAGSSSTTDQGLLHMGGLMDPGLAWGGYVASGSASPQSARSSEDVEAGSTHGHAGDTARYHELPLGQWDAGAYVQQGEGGGNATMVVGGATTEDVGGGGGGAAAGLVAAAAAAVMAAVTPHVYWGQDLGNWMPLGPAGESSGDEGGMSGGFWQDDSMDAEFDLQQEHLGRQVQQGEGGAGLVEQEQLAEAKVDQCCVTVPGDGEEACCICLDTMCEEERVVMLACGHRLHRPCLKAHVKASSRGGAWGSHGGAGPAGSGARGARQLLCPLCRAPMEAEQRGLVKRCAGPPGARSEGGHAGALLER